MSRRLGLLVALVAVLVLATPSAAVAQEPDDPEAVSEEDDSPPDEAPPPGSDDDLDDVEIEFARFPPGPFRYTPAFLDVWEANCGEGGFLSQMADTASDDHDVYLQWQKLVESNSNYDCGDRSSPSSRVGGTVYGVNQMPVGSYECGVDAGAWNHVDRKAFSTGCGILVAINSMLAGSTVELLEWAFSFRLAYALADGTAGIGETYFSNLNGSGGSWRSSAYFVALFFTTCWMGVKVLRGQVSRGFGELGLSMLLLMAFWVFQAQVGFSALSTNVLEGSGQMATGVSAAVLPASTSANCSMAAPAGSDDDLGYLTCPIADGLVNSLVERPYDLINWGVDLGDANDGANPWAACAQVRNQILSEAPHGNDDRPRYLMGQSAACSELADFNHSPSAMRWGTAFVSPLVTALVVVLLLFVSFTLLGVQFAVVSLAHLLPYFMITGALPGQGRALLWKWFGWMAKGFLVIVAMATLLAFYVSSLGAIAAVTAGESWIVQAGGLLFVTGFIFWLRKKAVAAAESGAGSLTSAVARSASVAGAGPGQFQLGPGSGPLAATPAEAMHAARSSGSGRPRLYQGAHDRVTGVRNLRQDHLDHRAMRQGYVPAVAPSRGLTAAGRSRSHDRAAIALRRRRRQLASATK